MTDMTVATNILNQLGGRRFTAMTGAKNFSGDASSLSFRIPRTKGKNGSVNHVKITLNSMDTYDVEYKRIHGMKVIPVGTSEGIYDDMLRGSFEVNTGLYTSF